MKYITECVTSGWISSLGPFVKRFEESVRAVCGVKHAVATSNGTTALHLALASLGIGRGDEVIVPDLTFVATANAVAYTGAKVVLADVDPVSWNLDPAAVERLITRRTRAIIPVHLYGHPCDMDAINRIARRHKVTVVEDAAEAIGAEYRGRMAGNLSKVATLSFYANKTITTGEGGMCLTNDDKLAVRMKFLRDHAMSAKKRYFHPEIGYNYRLTALQGAVGFGQMERFESIMAAKRRMATRYRQALAGVPGITLPPEQEGIRNSYWMYSVLVEPQYGMTRTALARQLTAEGIDSRPFFFPLHTMPPYRSRKSFPVATRLARVGLSLPSASTIGDADIDKVAAAIRAHARR